MADNIDFNFEWSTKPKNTTNNGVTVPAETLVFESLTSNSLKTRIAGKTIKLFVSGVDVAYFEIENINSIELKGSNITIYFGNKTANVLKFIDNSEATIASARLEIMLNGGTLS